MTHTARVVPDVPSFAVDGGFRYSIPTHLAEDLSVGSIVRVPLGGRRVRGWVVEITSDEPADLKEIAGISGSSSVFDPDQLRSLRWASQHYVAPVSVLLARATPPNLPRRRPPSPAIPRPGATDHPIARLARSAARGRKVPTSAIVANWRELEWLTPLGEILASGRSVLVVAASAAEVRLIARHSSGFGDAVATVSGDDDASDTAAWEAAQVSPRLVIGTPKTAAWRIGGLGLAIVLEEGRRAMKDRQTPTIHVRELLSVRSRIEGFDLVFVGPTPSVEVLSAGAEVTKVGNRAWPLVEVVDRSEEAPGSGFLSDRAMAAITSTATSGGRVFVFTHRRQGMASMRCRECRALRTCSSCGARMGRTEECLRCGARAGACVNCGGREFEEMGTIPDRLITEINRRAGSPLAAEPGSNSKVAVGTERDLAGLDRVELAIAADVDGLLMGRSHRTTEEALRQLARLAIAVTGAKGTRMMIQTSNASSDLVTTLRRGDPIPYLERVLVDRAREGMPPATEMIAVEARDAVPESAASDLASLDSAPLLLGPVDVPHGKRWLLVGALGETRLELRDLVRSWRDAGSTVRVDADPIDM